MITQMPGVSAVVPAVPPNMPADVYLNFPYYIAMCHSTVGSLLRVMNHFLHSLAKNALGGESGSSLYQQLEIVAPKSLADVLCHHKSGNI